jgi:hypothetical protein
MHKSELAGLNTVKGNKRGNNAVTEIIGSILLMAIVIAIFASIYVYVLSDSGPSNESYIKIVGKMEDGDVVFENRRGDSLRLDSEVILSLGGIKYLFNLYDNSLSFMGDTGDGTWNIGEKLVYSEMNTTGLQVESTIVDKVSKSVVWWGILQDGKIIEIPGAIWHFDEKSGNRAYDSLNNNTGWLKPDITYGPQWEDQFMASGASALKFDGINDYVLVGGDSVSLDLTNTISIESWIKFPEDYKLNNFNYGPAFGYEPDVIHVSGNVFAVVYRDQGEIGVLKTVNIASDGTITEDIHNNSLSVSDKCYWPKIVKVTDDIYMIAFIQSSINPKFANLRTVRMLDNGTTGPVLGSHTFGAKEVYDHCLIGISDNVTALIYRDKEDAGVIKTMTVTENGTSINLDNANSSFVFESSNCYEPNIKRLSGNIYAIAYRGIDNLGYLKTVEIADNGVISDNVIDTLVFDSINRSYNPQITHISGNIYGVVYRAETKNGILTTVEISNEGNITDQIIDSLLYETDYSELPKITHMHNDIYIIAYQSDQTDGYIAEIGINSDGYISNNVLSKYKFNTGKNYHGLEPDIIRVTDNIFGVAFRSGSELGTPHEGHLNTYKLINYNQNNYTLLEGNGIIFKKDTYGVYANLTHIAVKIGNHIITKEYSLSGSNWNHIVLTYDGSYIRVYCNGQVVISEQYAGGLSRSTNDILIGNDFFGFIDEVAIYGRILSSTEVQNHYNNPGVQ